MTLTIEKPALGSAAATFLTKELKMLIDGKWVAARSGKTFSVEDPATQETIAEVPAGDKADIDLAVAGSLERELLAIARDVRNDTNESVRRRR